MTELEFKQRWQRAEARLFDPDVGDWGMRDAYWVAEANDLVSSTADYTHVLSNGSPARKRLDHVLVSRQFDVQACGLWNGERGAPNGFRASDHTHVVASLTIE